MPEASAPTGDPPDPTEEVASKDDPKDDTDATKDDSDAGNAEKTENSDVKPPAPVKPYWGAVPVSEPRKRGSLSALLPDD